MAESLLGSLPVALRRDDRVRRRVGILAAAALASVLVATRIAAGSPLRAGNVLIAGAGLLELDPVSGVQWPIPVCGQCLRASGVGLRGDLVYFNRFGTYRLDPRTSLPTLVVKRLLMCDLEAGPAGAPVVAHCDGTLRRVDPVSGAQTTLLVLPPGTPPRFQFAFSPGGDLWVSSRKRLLRLRPPYRVPEASIPLESAARDLVVGPDDAAFVLDDAGRIVRLDGRTGERTTLLDADPRFLMSDLASGPDGSLLVAATDGSFAAHFLRVGPTTARVVEVGALPSAQAVAVAASANGDVYGATTAGLLTVPADGTATRLSPRRYTQLAVAPSGELIGVRRNAFTRVGDDGRPDTVLSLAAPAIEGIAVTRGGDVILANGAAGILRIGAEMRRPEELASGGELVAPTGVALGAAGEVYAADPAAAGGRGALVRVDVRTGAQRVVSAGGLFVHPIGVARSDAGDLFVTDTEAAGGGGAVIRVDPATGAQSIRSADGVFHQPTGIAVLPNGDLVVADPDAREGAGAVIRVDASGAQTVLATGRPYRDVALIPAPRAGVTNAASPRSTSEICGNCVDDDGDGLVDYEDPTCCVFTRALAGRWATSGSGRRRLHVRARLHLNVDPREDPITVQVRDARGPLRCQVLHPDAWSGTRRGYDLSEGSDVEGFKAGRLRFGARGRARVQLVSRKGVVRGLRPPALAVTVHSDGLCATGVLRFGGGPLPAESPGAPLCQ